MFTVIVIETLPGPRDTPADRHTVTPLYFHIRFLDSELGHKYHGSDVHGSLPRTRRGPREPSQGSWDGDAGLTPDTRRWRQSFVTTPAGPSTSPAGREFACSRAALSTAAPAAAPKRRDTGAFEPDADVLNVALARARIARARQCESSKWPGYSHHQEPPPPAKKG